MGSGISEMTSSRGFVVEWMASLVGLVGTAAGINKAPSNYMLVDKNIYLLLFAAFVATFDSLSERFL